MIVALYLIIIMFSSPMVASEDVFNQNESLNTKYEELKKSAENGNINSQYEIFHFVAKKRPQLDKNLSEAFGFIIQAGQAGHVEAQFTIGSMYQTGYLLDKNNDVALDWLLEAAKQDHPQAQLLVANNYSVRVVDAKEGEEDEKAKNKKQASYWYEKAVENKSMLAARLYGELLFIDDIFSEKAKHFLELAANNGDLKAMNMLGRMYSHRWGENRGQEEFELAHSWFEKAKNSGFKSQPFIDELNEKKKLYLEELNE